VAKNIASLKTYGAQRQIYSQRPEENMLGA